MWHVVMSARHSTPLGASASLVGGRGFTCAHGPGCQREHRKRLRGSEPSKADRRHCRGPSPHREEMLALKTLEHEPGNALVRLEVGPHVLREGSESLRHVVSLSGCY